jgi:hypothetical protein
MKVWILVIAHMFSPADETRIGHFDSLENCLLAATTIVSAHDELDVVRVACNSLEIPE